MRKRFEETQRFRTRSGDGAECYVVELTTFDGFDDAASTRWIPVNQAYRTADGEAVQLRPDGEFVVVGTGARLVRG